MLYTTIKNSLYNKKKVNEHLQSTVKMYIVVPGVALIHTVTVGGSITYK